MKLISAQPIIHYALYNVRACVCVRVLNHLNPFYGDCGSFTVKTDSLTVKRRAFEDEKWKRLKVKW